MKNSRIDKALESDLPFKPNPLYGTGVFRRRVRLRKQESKGRSTEQLVIADLEDDNHRFRIMLYHDGQVVTRIEGEALRYPLTTCPGSLDLLKELVGTPLSDDPRSLGVRLDPRRFCTHQFDLAGLAITHALRDGIEQQYDIIVHDQTVGEDMCGWHKVEAAINGQTVFKWDLKDFVIQSEGLWNNVSIMHGFSKWAVGHLSGSELEAALILTRAVFVSNSRRFDISSMAGKPALVAFMQKDVCYSYRSPIVEQATYVGDAFKDET